MQTTAAVTNILVHCRSIAEDTIVEEHHDHDDVVFEDTPVFNSSHRGMRRGTSLDQSVLAPSPPIFTAFWARTNRKKVRRHSGPGPQKNVVSLLSTSSSSTSCSSPGSTKGEEKNSTPPVMKTGGRGKSLRDFTWKRVDTEDEDVGVPHIMVTPDQHDSISSPISTSCPPAHPSQDEGFRPRAGTWSSRQRHVSSGAHGTYGSSQHSISLDITDVGSGKQTPTGQSSHSFLDALGSSFRPRSKSDASSRKKSVPSMFTSMKRNLQHTISSPPNSSHDSSYSGSEGGGFGGSTGSDRRNPVTKVLDIFSRHHHHSRTSSDNPHISSPILGASYPPPHYPQRKTTGKHLLNANHINASNQTSAFRRHSVQPGGAGGPPLLLSHTPPRAGAISPHSVERRGSLPGGFLESDKHPAVLFRDSRLSKTFDASYPYSALENALDGDESQLFVKFFKFHKVYDLIPTSAKLVMFDIKLQVKKAFFALVHNGVRAAPLWDSTFQKFVGMLTITDFIRILRMYYRSPEKEMGELEEHKLETWRKELQHEFQPLIAIGPDASLYQAVSRLLEKKIHRLPVIDPATGDVIYIVTHKRLFRFLCLHLKSLPRPSCLDQTLAELGIGTFNDVAVAREDTQIIEALGIFLDRRISALPILDSSGKLCDIYSKFDAINLAAQGSYNRLDITLKEANQHRNDWFEGVTKCTEDETLGTIMDRIAKAEVHRIVVVDSSNHVKGVVSLSDILNFLVLKPGREEEQRFREEEEEEETARAASITPPLNMSGEASPPSPPPSSPFPPPSVGSSVLSALAEA